MALTQPLFEQNDDTDQHALDMRLLSGTIFDNRGGICGTSHFQVHSRTAGANMSVEVEPGAIIIPGTNLAGGQGVYHLTNNAVTNVEVPAAHATQTRRDLLIVKVRDSFYGGTENDAVFEWVQGTPGSSSDPDPHALGHRNFWVLARVRLPAAATSVSNSIIDDLRTTSTGQFGQASTLGGLITCTSTTRPSGVRAGTQIFETDTQRVWIWSGSSWILMAGPPVHARVDRNGPIGIPNNVEMMVPWDREVIASDAGMRSGAQPTRITVPAGLGGLYLLETNIVFPGHDIATGTRAAGFKINNGSRISQVEVNATLNRPTGLASTATARLAAGSYVEVWAFQALGGGWTIINPSFFSITRIGP